MWHIFTAMTKKKRTQHKVLLRKAMAYTRYGLKIELAEYLGVGPSAITMMFKNNRVSHKHWEPIQELSNGAIKVSAWR